MLDKKSDEQYEAEKKRKEEQRATKLKKKLEEEKKEKFKKRVIAEILVGVFLILFVWGYKNGAFSNTNLIQAVQKNYTARLCLILAAGQATQQEINEVLLRAIYYNDLKMTKILVMAGADINYCGEDDFAHPLLQQQFIITLK